MDRLKLATVAGHRTDTTLKQKAAVDRWYEVLESKKTAASISPRVCATIQSLVELRRNQWQPAHQASQMPGGGQTRPAPSIAALPVPVPLTSAGADPRAPALVGAMVAFLEHQPGHMLHSLDMLKFYTAHPGYRVRFLNRA